MARADWRWKKQASCFVLNQGTTLKLAKKLIGLIGLYQGASGEPTRWVGRAPQTLQD
jgi:hypothetical protein